MLTSTVSCIPKPSHSGQAPCGLLKEKIRGSKSPNVKSQCLQLYLVENNCVVSSLTSSISTKSLLERFSDVSNESAKRVSIPSLITILSIITLIECFLFLSNSGISPTSYNSPSILNRIYPSFISLSINFL